MSEKSKAPAFKEWASVVEALGQGEQIFVLRKGGIHEGKGGFSVDHQQFWLFPTKFHQQASKVKAGTPVPKWIHNESRSTIPLQYWAQLDEYTQLTDRECLESLNDDHIWSEQTIEEKFTWGAENAVYLLFLKVFKIPHLIELEDDPRFGGCKSWIEIPAKFLPESSVPVLENKLFEHKKNDVLEKLKKP